MPQMPAARTRQVAAVTQRWRGQRLGVAAQHPRRRHAQHGGERRQAEQQATPDAQARGRAAGRPAARGGSAAPGCRSRNRRGQRRAARPRRRGSPTQAAGEAEQDGLAEVEREDLARAHAQALEDRDRVQPAGEPGPHALGDADAADEEREQGDQAEEALDPARLSAAAPAAPGGRSRPRKARAAREHLLQPLGGGVERGVGCRAGQPDQRAVADAAAAGPRGGCGRSPAPERKTRGPRVNETLTPVGLGEHGARRRGTAGRRSRSGSPTARSRRDEQLGAATTAVPASSSSAAGARGRRSSLP